ncbi:MAG: hypothetical protein PVH34_12990, partial [Syntrophobacterales bacterium]
SSVHPLTAQIRAVGNKQPILDKLIQRIGIVLLLLAGLSSSGGIIGKKCAWDSRHCYGFENLLGDQSST